MHDWAMMCYNSPTERDLRDVFPIFQTCRLITFLHILPFSFTIPNKSLNSTFAWFSQITQTLALVYDKSTRCTLSKHQYPVWDYTRKGKLS